MEPENLTVEILKSLRDEMKQTREQLSERIDSTNSRLDTTNTRLDTTNARLEAMHEELSQRIVHSEIRTATAIAELAGTVREMTQVLRSSAELRPRVERCENDISELRTRIDRIEPR